MIRRTLDVTGLTKFLKTCKSFDGVLQKDNTQLTIQAPLKLVCALLVASQIPLGSFKGSFFPTHLVYAQSSMDVQIISVGNGKCLAELKIENEHTNAMGGLHGGFSATLVDNISGYALLSTLDAKIRTVSVDIHLSYLKRSKINDIIVIDTKLVKCGKKLAYMEAEIRNKENGEILVKGTHSRFLLR